MKNLGLEGRVRLSVIDPDSGRVFRKFPWQKNLILDQGMDMVPTTLFNGLFTACAAGTDTSPTDQASGSVTATVSGTTITASAPFFTTAMVASDVLFPGNIRFKILSLGGASPSATATLKTAGTIASATAFTIQYVTQAALGTEVKRSSIYATDPDANQAIVSPGSVTLQRTFVFSPESTNITYTELGLSPNPNPGPNLFSRILLAAPVSLQGPSALLPSGQALKVTYQLLVSFDYGSGAGNYFSGVNTGTVPVTNLPVAFPITKYANSGTVPGTLAVTVTGSMPAIVGQPITLAGSATSAYNGTWTVMDVTSVTDPTHGLSTIITLGGATWTSAPGSISSDNLTTSLLGGFFRGCQGIYLIGPTGQSMAPTPTDDAFLGFGEPGIFPVMGNHPQAWASPAGLGLGAGNGTPVSIDPSQIYTVQCLPNAYTNGNFYLDQVANITVGTPPNISSFGFGLPDQTNQIETYFWNGPQGLVVSSTLSITFRLSWARN